MTLLKSVSFRRFLSSSLLMIVATLPTIGTAQYMDAQATLPIIWSDHFNGAFGESPDSDAWNYDIGNAAFDGWGNQELQYYTDRPENVSQTGSGQLVINATRLNGEGDHPCWNGTQCAYASARLTTRGKITLTTGRVEARIKLPPGVGLWGAFWMLGASGKEWPLSGEIDVMEWVGSDPLAIYGTIHGPGFTDSNGVGGKFEQSTSLADAYHVYAVEKVPGKISWFVDGNRYYEVTRESLPDGAEWIFDDPFYLILNLAVGGTWPGHPAPETVFPASMLIDYVRVSGEGVVPGAGERSG